MRSLFLALLYVFGAGTLSSKEKPPAIYTIPLPPKPNFSPLEWLIGEWRGSTIGRGTQGDLHLSVEFALDRKFMILREELTLAATDGAPPTREVWMGILSGTGSEKKFLLQMFSSTGFIIRFQVSVEGPEIQFNPEGGEQPPPGWLFRRVVQRSGEAELKETVQIAPPNRPFFEYYAAKLTPAPHP